MSKNTTEYSKSKQKRMAIQEAADKRARQQTAAKAVAAVLAVAVVCALGAWAFTANLFHVQRLFGLEIDPQTDYTAYLTDDGKIQDINTADYVGTFDVSSVTLDEADVTYTDDELQSHIDSLLSSNKELITDTSKAAISGDTLSINYVGTVDGEEFDGGSADEQDLELGSGTFIDGFEDQLVGTHPGDDVTVNVTFPDDYGVDSLNGKDAVFEVHVNGIYELPAFDDSFVQTYLSDSGYTTAEDYKAGYRAEQEASLYADAIDTWIGENVTPSSYPKDYLRQVKGLQMTEDQNTFEQVQAFYEAYGATFDYEDYQAYYATDDQSYAQVRDGKAKTRVTKALVYQNVFENAGLTITDEDYQTYLDENSIDDDDLETYGKAYYMQQIIQEKALAYMQDLVTVTAATETEESASEATTIEE